MTREIKFRAWDKEAGVMIPDIFQHFAGAGDILQEPYYIPLQYTGLKDKNGKEIYEGDIISYVSYDGATTLFPVEWNNFDNEGNMRPGFQIHPPWVDYVSVAGNIYENPEILNDNDRKE